MPLGLIFVLGIVAIIVICVVASQMYPRVSNQTNVEAEQDITGIGPETNLKADAEDTKLG